jgi:hypothetical protein
MVRDFCESWEKYGAQAIETLRKKKPVDYVRIAAQLIPKEFLVKDQAADGMTDDQLGAVAVPGTLLFAEPAQLELHNSCWLPQSN